MTRADELLALAERVETLTGPDREVDAEIAVAVNAGSRPGAHKEMLPDEIHRRCGYIRHVYAGGSCIYESRRYTRSLDAALGVSGGKTTLLRLTEDGGDNCALARVGCHTLPDAPVFEGRALSVVMGTEPLADLAIATIAAQLRALAAIETGAAG